jgi:hypothetical protein
MQCARDIHLQTANGWQRFNFFCLNGCFLQVCMHYMIQPAISSALTREKELLMELSQLPPFQLERWFAEFEFVQGMRNLAASGPFAVTTRELLELEGAETTAAVAPGRWLEAGP